MSSFCRRGSGHHNSSRCVDDVLSTGVRMGGVHDDSTGVVPDDVRSFVTHHAQALQPVFAAERLRWLLARTTPSDAASPLAFLHTCALRWWSCCVRRAVAKLSADNVRAGDRNAVDAQGVSPATTPTAVVKVPCHQVVTVRARMGMRQCSALGLCSTPLSCNLELKLS